MASFLRHVPVRILESQYEFLCLHGRQKIDLLGEPGHTVSLIPLAGPVTGVRLNGFEYPLANESLAVGTTRGISNLFMDEKAGIEIEGGHLLVVIDRTQRHRNPGTGSCGSGR